MIVELQRQTALDGAVQIAEILGRYGKAGSDRLLKREQVMDFILSRGFQPFTTLDIADALSVKEHQARAAVSWLKLGEYIKESGAPQLKLKIYLKKNGLKQKLYYPVKIYIWTGKSSKISICSRNMDERKLNFSMQNNESNGEAVQDILNVFMRRK